MGNVTTLTGSSCYPALWGAMNNPCQERAIDGSHDTKSVSVYEVPYPSAKIYGANWPISFSCLFMAAPKCPFYVSITDGMYERDF